MKIHKRLYTYIQDKGISIDDISKNTGIPNSRLKTVFEKEDCNMLLDEYVAVCTALNLPIDYFNAHAQA